MNPIFHRSSVRNFTDQPVTEAQIDAMMHAAMAAPSAGNQQPWEFVVVDDPEMLAALGEISPYSKPAARAPLAIVPVYRTDNLRFEPMIPQDMSASIENILLEAVNQELGAVWIGIAPHQDRMQDLGTLLNLPDGIEPFAIIAIGHPADEDAFAEKGRYDETRVHRNTYA